MKKLSGTAMIFFSHLHPKVSAHFSLKVSDVKKKVLVGSDNFLCLASKIIDATFVALEQSIFSYFPISNFQHQLFWMVHIKKLSGTAMIFFLFTSKSFCLL